MQQLALVLTRFAEELAPESNQGSGHSVMALDWDLESPWLLPDDQTTVTPGMCLTVEKKLALGDIGVWREVEVLIGDDETTVITAD